MLSRNERQKLLRDMDREPASALGLVLKCSACLLILVGLAVIGSSPDLESDAPFGAPGAGGPAQHRERASIADARKTFDERRARFEGQTVDAHEVATR
jgi:hypothetical protein